METLLHTASAYTLETERDWKMERWRKTAIETDMREWDKIALEQRGMFKKKIQLLMQKEGGEQIITHNI